MATNTFSGQASGSVSKRDLISLVSHGDAQSLRKREVSVSKGVTSSFPLDLESGQLNSWSQSEGKRVFDLLSVLLVLPLFIPVFIAVALAVRLTSFGPALFTQRRTGRNGRPFTILKFRTMEHARPGAHKSVTTAGNQRFTIIGPFLRRWKLDELPQLFNVLWGDMSLVGPRPKLPQHQVGKVPWRPGITGAATLAFAREEEFLATVPDDLLDSYYHRTILPAKHQLDVEYMSSATLPSDIKMLVDTVLRRWSSSAIGELLKEFEEDVRMRETNVPVPATFPNRVLVLDCEESLASGD